jgi:murein DD-endopeptidase MepM/ murein hydrolase activator NlpD
MKKLNKLLLLLLVLFLVLTVWYSDFTDPIVTWEAPSDVGKDSQIRLQVEDEGKGLRGIELILRQADTTHTLYSQTHPRTVLPWKQGPPLEELSISTQDWASELGLEDGMVELTVKAEDQSSFWLFSGTVEQSRSFNLDTKPPRAEVLSNQHYLRQGGSEAVLYRVTEQDCSSGVQVGGNSFLGYPVPQLGDGTHIALFAMAHDQELETPVSLWAADPAGNRSETRFWYKPLPASFRKRRIEITDRFIDSVAPEILSHSPTIEQQNTLLETFLQINRELRSENNQLISDLSKDSRPEPLWSEPFLQLSNSKVESVFADHRTYYYEGKPVDEQTHLGFDLASLARSAVEASNSGRVVFADYLGIYGNCVILDHGLGLFSLYGHLSSLNVEKGQNVSRGESLGRTGQTGLAGGDHLHYSMIVQGVQVSPLEWWDPNWVRLHVMTKLRKPEAEAG